MCDNGQLAEPFQGQPLVSAILPTNGGLYERVIRFSESDDLIKAYFRADGVKFAYQLAGMKHRDYAKSDQI